MTRRIKGRPKPKPEFHRVLAMTLNREPFDLIIAGKKKAEYRENKPYWRKRLIGIKYKEAHFRNGYARDAPFARRVSRCLEVRKGPRQLFWHPARPDSRNQALQGALDHVCPRRSQNHQGHQPLYFDGGISAAPHTTKTGALPRLG